MALGQLSKGCLAVQLVRDSFLGTCQNSVGMLCCCRACVQARGPRTVRHEVAAQRQRYRSGWKAYVRM
jgi:hypothetical protein